MILFWLLYCQAESMFVGWHRNLCSAIASCLSGGVNGGLDRIASEVFVRPAGTYFHVLGIFEVDLKLYFRPLKRSNNFSRYTNNTMYLSLSLQHYLTYDNYSLPAGEPLGNVRLTFRTSSGGCGGYVAGVFAPAFSLEHFLSFIGRCKCPPATLMGAL